MSEKPKNPSPLMGEGYPPMVAPKATRGKGGGEEEGRQASDSLESLIKYSP
jgi:hypothetical protein